MPIHFDPRVHHRRSIRLKGYDYSQGSAYFVTVVTSHRACLFGDVVDQEMRLNEAGKIVQWEWQELPRRFRFIELGPFVVMPNHFHAVLIIRDTVGATRPDSTAAKDRDIASLAESIDGPEGSPLPPRGPRAGSIGAIMAQFKARVTRQVWKLDFPLSSPLWQRNYYEHIIRNDREMDKFWRYIECNPVTWATDEDNPSSAPALAP